jgi:hypothetical protein
MGQIMRWGNALFGNWGAGAAAFTVASKNYSPLAEYSKFF